MALKPGRKPLDPNDPSKMVCLKMPSRQYDQLYAQAQRERITIGDVIRRELAKEMRRLNRDDE